MNKLFYDLAVALDATAWSTSIHESYYLYNWIETTHVLTLMVSLGLLFLVDLRMLGLAFAEIPAKQFADRIRWPMLIGFVVMFLTGILLFYAIPVRTTQSLWFRIKVVLLIAAAINLYFFYRSMKHASPGWEQSALPPRSLRVGAGLSLVIWAGVVICGRLIAYDWYDCIQEPSEIIASIAGCVPGQEQF